MAEPESRKLTITDWAAEDRPREKLILKGRSALSDAELLAILIGSGSLEESAVDLAKRILVSADHNLNKLARMGLKDLTKIKGIGPAKAVSILAAIELGRRRKESDFDQPESLQSSQLVYEFMKPELLDLAAEQFWVVLLSRNLKPIRKFKVGEGGISSVVVDLRLIYKEALENLATAIILVHNHPSGNLNPSDEDRRITRKLVEAGRLLDINVIEHLIFTNQGYYSFADRSEL